MDEQSLRVGGGQEVNSGHDGACVCIHMYMCLCTHASGGYEEELLASDCKFLSQSSTCIISFKPMFTRSTGCVTS